MQSNFFLRSWSFLYRRVCWSVSFLLILLWSAYNIASLPEWESVVPPLPPGVLLYVVRTVFSIEIANFHEEKKHRKERILMQKDSERERERERVGSWYRREEIEVMYFQCSLRISWQKGESGWIRIINFLGWERRRKSQTRNRKTRLNGKIKMDDYNLGPYFSRFLVSSSHWLPVHVLFPFF